MSNPYIAFQSLIFFDNFKNFWFLYRIHNLELTHENDKLQVD